MNDANDVSNLPPVLTPIPLANRVRGRHVITPARRILGSRRYSLSSNGSPTPLNSVPNSPGPLLATTNYSVNLNTYIDSKSAGYTGRLVEYSEEGNSKKQFTHQEKYNSPGFFPVVHMFKKDIPVVSPKPNKVMVRLSSPDTRNQFQQEHNRLLLDGILRSNNVLMKNNNEGSGENGTRSVLDVLKEISKKRLHANVENLTNKKLRIEGEAEEESAKRGRSDSPPKTSSTTSFQTQAKKKFCSINPIYASRTSSMYDEYIGNKRKIEVLSIDDRSETPPINKKFLNVETQTIGTKANKDASVKEAKISNVEIAPPAEKNVKDMNEKEEGDSDEVKETPVLKIFDDKPLEVIRKNRLGALLSALTGETIPPIPMTDRKKELDSRWTNSDIVEDNSTGKKIVSILSHGNEGKLEKKISKHVSFSSLPNDDSQSKSKEVSNEKPLPSISGNVAQSDLKNDLNVCSNMSKANLEISQKSTLELPTSSVLSKLGEKNITNPLGLPPPSSIYGSDKPAVSKEESLLGNTLKINSVTPPMKNFTKSATERVDKPKDNLDFKKSSSCPAITSQKTTITTSFSSSTLNPISSLLTPTSTFVATPKNNTLGKTMTTPIFTSANVIDTKSSSFAITSLQTQKSISGADTLLKTSSHAASPTSSISALNTTSPKPLTQPFAVGAPITSIFGNPVANNSKPNTVFGNIAAASSPPKSTTSSTLITSSLNSAAMTLPSYNYASSGFSFTTSSSTNLKMTASVAPSNFGSSVVSTTKTSSPISFTLPATTSAPIFGSTAADSSHFGNSLTTFSAFGTPLNSGSISQFGTPATKGTGQASGSEINSLNVAVSTPVPTFNTLSTSAPFFGAQTTKDTVSTTRSSTLAIAATSAPAFGVTSSAPPTFGVLTTSVSTFNVATTSSSAFGNTATNNVFGTKKPVGSGGFKFDLPTFTSQSNANNFLATTTANNSFSNIQSANNSPFGTTATPVKPFIFSQSTNNNGNNAFGSTVTTSATIGSSSSPMFNLKNSQSGMTMGTNTTASTFNSGSTSAFGANANVFGNTNVPAFGTNSNLIFGSKTAVTTQTTSMTSSSFPTSSTMFTAPKTTAAVPMFGAPNPFGANKSFGSFGSSGASPFNTTVTSTTTGFSTSTNASSISVFGNSGAQTVSTFGGTPLQGTPGNNPSVSSSTFGGFTSGPFGAQQNQVTFGTPAKPDAFRTSTNVFNTNNNVTTFGTQAQSNNTSNGESNGVFTFGAPTSQAASSNGVFAFGSTETPKTFSFNSPSFTQGTPSFTQGSGNVPNMFNIGSGSNSNKGRPLVKAKRRT